MGPSHTLLRYRWCRCAPLGKPPTNELQRSVALALCGKTSGAPRQPGAASSNARQRGKGRQLGQCAAHMPRRAPARPDTVWRSEHPTRTHAHPLVHICVPRARAQRPSLAPRRLRDVGWRVRDCAACAHAQTYKQPTTHSHGLTCTTTILAREVTFDPLAAMPMAWDPPVATIASPSFVRAASASSARKAARASSQAFPTRTHAKCPQQRPKIALRRGPSAHEPDRLIRPALQRRHGGGNNPARGTQGAHNACAIPGAQAPARSRGSRAAARPPAGMRGPYFPVPPAASVVEPMAKAKTTFHLLGSDAAPEPIWRDKA